MAFETTPLQLIAVLLALCVLAVLATKRGDIAAHFRRRWEARQMRYYRSLRERYAKPDRSLRYSLLHPLTHSAIVRRPLLWLIKMAAAVIWLPLFASIIWGLYELIQSLPDLLRHAGTAPDPLPLRLTLLGITALTAALGALVAFPFTILRTQYNARQTHAAEQGHITDRISKAVEALGAEKSAKRRVDKWSKGRKTYVIEEVSEPNVEVRIGGIYALERISQDSERDHIRIMEILCAYIRENAPADQAPPFELDPWPDYPEELNEANQDFWDNAMKSWKRALHDTIAKLKAPRPDIQTAMDVIGRRSARRIRFEQSRKHRGQETYRLDLRGVNLRGADLSRLNLSRAKLERSLLQGASFLSANLDGADLAQASLQGADFSAACLAGADLKSANLQLACLLGASLQASDFTSASMQEANLSGAQLQYAILSRAKLHIADFINANLSGAKFARTQMQAVDLSHAVLQGAFFQKTVFDSATTFLPKTLKGAAFLDVDLSMLRLGAELGRFRGSFGDRSAKPHPLWGKSRPDKWEKEETLGFTNFMEHWRAHCKRLGL
ncbi:pentapeptide repeat-containing protein [Mangrovicoccus sp. HB161399]|uniref:pentapeptide repeat-containing protein n=1 Tax=Mangrovicoccus sp. HB161399 TaxID=2720392 RepID=UPI001556AFCC|nr:pentapeptide repeat-containing protein [Mangrovicoccus sp. HB161399]